MKQMILIATTLFSGLALAEDCAMTIDSTDTMQFSTSEMVVPASCDSYTVTLKHTGTLPRNIMGHNWVLSKTADAQAIAGDGVGAGLNNDYIKPGDGRVIAYTKVIGGGEETSVTFDVNALSADESYQFFCSFPGHIGVMKGALKVQ
ncbi:azurin [Aestuariibacter sp. A3R04]|uniref:azurin n=1 Tax=Aestuariibacter sp. A3R04 TaxID=2841571 RepID=UPI001C0906A3|nr:azurin [Aestuariibacter sp. A3R04]MBU3023799.1 azurin [Aestuariibacter sp. A3R04]